jgi:hypothetical protein
MKTKLKVTDHASMNGMLWTALSLADPQVLILLAASKFAKYIIYKLAFYPDISLVRLLM